MCMDVRRVRSSPVADVLSMMQRVWHGKDVWVTWEMDSWRTLLSVLYRRGRGDRETRYGVRVVGGTVWSDIDRAYSTRIRPLKHG